MFWYAGHSLSSYMNTFLRFEAAEKQTEQHNGGADLVLVYVMFKLSSIRLLNFKLNFASSFTSRPYDRLTIQSRSKFTPAAGLFLPLTWWPYFCPARGPCPLCSWQNSWIRTEKTLFFFFFRKIVYKSCRCTCFGNHSKHHQQNPPSHEKYTQTHFHVFTAVTTGCPHVTFNQTINMIIWVCLQMINTLPGVRWPCASVVAFDSWNCDDRY